MIIMSKRFKSQDYFRYKKLGKRWRRPVGLQSKLRLKKGGSGMKPAVGYGSPFKAQPTLIRSSGDFEKDCSNGIIFSSTLGSRKTALLAAKAKELGLTIVNMKKVKRASRLQTALAKKKESRTKKEEEKAAEKAKEAKDKTKEKKMGFHESVVTQLTEGKTKTYRLRDHGLKVGDIVKFENSQSTETIGNGKITNVEHTKIAKINLKDKAHHKTYDNLDELIAAFKQHYPDKSVTPETDVWIYTYEFTPSKK